MELPQEFKTKSFWERKEGFTGILFGVGALFGLWLLSPIILAAFNSMVLLGIICAAIYVVMDPKFRNIVSYGYKLGMKWLTSLFITIDPIGILNEYVARLERKLEVIDDLLQKLWGQITKLRNKIELRKREALKAKKISDRAQEQNNTAQVLLNRRKAGRLVESSRSLEEVLNKAEVMYRVLKKMKETCSLMVEDTKSVVETAKDDYETTNEAHKAMTKIKSVMMGGSDKELYDETLDYVMNTTAQKLGEMEHFMEIAQKFNDKSDIENGIYAEDSLKMLEEWEKNPDSMLLGASKTQVITESYDPLNVLDSHSTASIPHEINKKDEVDFKKLLN